MGWYTQGFKASVEEKLQARVTKLVRADPTEYGLDRADFDSDADYDIAVGDVVSDLSKSQRIIPFLIENMGEGEFQDFVGDDNRGNS
jgi:hypothetical protein